MPRATKRSLLAPKSEIKEANKAKTPYGEKSMIMSTIFKIISLSPSIKPLTYRVFSEPIKTIEIPKIRAKNMICSIFLFSDAESIIFDGTISIINCNGPLSSTLLASLILISALVL